MYPLYRTSFSVGCSFGNSATSKQRSVAWRPRLAEDLPFGKGDLLSFVFDCSHLREFRLTYR